MEKKFWHNSVVYQIYPRSFNDSTGNGEGDIIGIINKLEYLKNLGVDVIWLSPVYKSPMEDNGYDISDYQDIRDEFGTLEDMDMLIGESSKLGIKIVMDLVVNHTSSEHYWFKEARKSKDNKYRDYYIWRDEPNDIKSIFGGSAWEYDELTNQYYFHQFAKGQPDLNWKNEKVVKEIHDMMNWWLDKGIGGFRMDVIDLIGKDIDKGVMTNGPKLHQLLNEMNKATFGNRDVLTVGETLASTLENAKLYSNPIRNELSMIFQFEHLNTDLGSYGKWNTNELNLPHLKAVMGKWQTNFDEGDGWNSLFWNNHDLPRIVSRWGNDTKYREESAKMFAIVLHLMKGTPYIYQGEEIGMTNVKFDKLSEYNDVEIHESYDEYVVREKVMTHDEFMKGVYKMGRDNARTPMQWDSSENAGFSEGKPWLRVNPNYADINVKNDLRNKNSIFYTYKELINLRRSSCYSDVVVYGSFELLLPEDKNIFAYKRKYKNMEMLIVANFSDKVVSFDIKEEVEKLVISNYVERHENFAELRPYEAYAVTLK